MCFRYDLFQNAFEHVSTIIDDIYKVHTGSHFGSNCALLTMLFVSQKLSNNTSAQAFLGPENAEV